MKSNNSTITPTLKKIDNIEYKGNPAIISSKMNTLEDLKLYCLNITSATVVSLGWLEPLLSILLLLTTLGYTAHKWYLLKNEK